MQTADTTAHWSLELEKGARSRREEEEIVSRMVLMEKEQVETEQIAAPRSWQDLFLGRVEVTPEVGGQRSEVGGQRSEVGGQRSEVGGQRSEVRGRRSEVRGRRLK
jgi:hypothetical protein